MVSPLPSSIPDIIASFVSPVETFISNILDNKAHSYFENQNIKNFIHDLRPKNFSLKSNTPLELRSDLPSTPFDNLKNLISSDPTSAALLGAGILVGAVVLCTIGVGLIGKVAKTEIKDLFRSGLRKVFNKKQGIGLVTDRKQFDLPIRLFKMRYGPLCRLHPIGMGRSGIALKVERLLGKPSSVLKIYPDDARYKKDLLAFDFLRSGRIENSGAGFRIVSLRRIFPRSHAFEAELAPGRNLKELILEGNLAQQEQLISQYEGHIHHLANWLETLGIKEGGRCSGVIRIGNVRKNIATINVTNFKTKAGKIIDLRIKPDNIIFNPSNKIMTIIDPY